FVTNVLHNREEALMTLEQKLAAVLRASGDKCLERGLELNRGYQARIETIRTRLWTTLTWLAAAQGAVLVLSMKESGLRAASGPELLIDQPMLLVLLPALAIYLACYMRNVAYDGVHHIRRNMQYSTFTLDYLVKQVSNEVHGDAASNSASKPPAARDEQV